MLLGDEAIIVGDIVLPDISPWPIREAMYDEVAKVIQPYYRERQLFWTAKVHQILGELGELLTSIRLRQLRPSNILRRSVERGSSGRAGR